MKKFSQILAMSCKFMLLLMAIILSGGYAMAVEIGDNGSDVDPNEETPLEGATPDSTEEGIDQQGKGATGSAIEEAELDEAQVEDYISKHEAWKYPLHTDYLRLARKANVTTKKPKHPVMGEAILECFTKGITANPDHAHTVELNLFGNDNKIFPEKGTIRVFGQTGYDEDGNPNGSCLMLYVVENNRGTKVIVEAVNGPKDTPEGETYVPEIPAGTKLRAMAPALSESELRVASDNFLPGWKQAYLQKKACAITMTEFFKRIKKKVNFGGQMVKDEILSTFRRKSTTTLLCGAPGKRLAYDPVTGVEENTYFQEGILTQIQNSYQLNGLPQISDLIAITRQCFTKYAKSNKAQAYCGSLFLEWLGNMDYSKHPEIHFTSQRDALNVKVGKFDSNFGTIEFKLDYSMDENDLSGCAIILPMEEAIRYIYEEKTVKHDHKNDTEARDAESEYYIVDDCLMLTGLTSMFVGNDVSAAGLRPNDYNNIFVSTPSLKDVTSPEAGKIYYLTQQEGSNPVAPYVYENGEWVLWSGDVQTA